MYIKQDRSHNVHCIAQYHTATLSHLHLILNYAIPTTFSGQKNFLWSHIIQALIWNGRKDSRVSYLDPENGNTTLK